MTVLGATLRLVVLLFPDVLMVGGAALVLAGVYLLLGLAWLLILSGLLSLAGGVTIEVLNIRRKGGP